MFRTLMQVMLVFMFGIRMLQRIRYWETQATVAAIWGQNVFSPGQGFLRKSEQQQFFDTVYTRHAGAPNQYSA